MAKCVPSRQGLSALAKDEVPVLTRRENAGIYEGVCMASLTHSCATIGLWGRGSAGMGEDVSDCWTFTLLQCPSF